MNPKQNSIHEGLHPDVREVLTDKTTTTKDKLIQLNKMIFNTLGTANKTSTPKIVDKIPEKLSNIMHRIYAGESEGIFDYDIDHNSKVIDTFFGGFGEHLTEIDPAVNAKLMFKVGVGHYDSVRKTNYYKGLKSHFTELLKYAEENGYKVNINTHSFGSTIARLLADENPSKAINEMNMLNAHMSPFKMLKKLPDHIKLKYHTNINDVLNLKQLFPFQEGEHTYYSGTKGGLLSNHTQEGFTDVERSSSNLMKNYARAGRVAGIVGLGLTLADVASRIHKDSNEKVSKTTKAINITTDVAAVGSGFLAGGAVAGAILAPEITFPALLASFVVGGGVGAGVDHAVSSLFHSKNGKDTPVVHTLRTGRDVNNDNIRSKIGSSFKRKNKEWEHRVNKVGHFFKGLF